MDCLDSLESFVPILIFIAISIGGRVLSAFTNRAEQTAGGNVGALQRIINELTESAPSPAPAGPTAEELAAASAARAERKDEARRRIDALAKAIAAEAYRCRYELANRRLLDTLENYLPARLDRARAALNGSSSAEDAVAEVEWLAFLLAMVQAFAAQRRQPMLAAQLGDADALAEACYAPIFGFAQEQQLKLRSSHPVTLLGEFDLAIWSGFVPTSLAAIFLPAEFFSRLSWWPAIAHEIGHDFLASLNGLEDSLRQELKLPSERTGQQLLRIQGRTFDTRQAWSIYGAWFEELFADLFGTAMLGPAYVISMIDLFSEVDDANELLWVGLTDDGRGYDSHPPRHLRLLLCCRALELIGMHQDAALLRKRWLEETGLDQEQQESLIAATSIGVVTLPLAPFVQNAARLVEALYIGPLQSLGGFGLRDVVGLDYGPHRQAQSEQVRDNFLAGRSGAIHGAPAVIAGAVLAADRRPEQHREILALARAAIPAIGTREAGQRELPSEAAAMPSSDSRQLIIDAVLLGETLGTAATRRRLFG